MWNDTDIPLAYLITFRSHGTWLHGDERGSVDRFHNHYMSPRLPADRARHQHSLIQLSCGIVTLNTKQRESVELAIRDTCEVRKWFLRAINVRTNHIHAVVSIGTTKPERALNDFKATGPEGCAETVVGSPNEVRERTKAVSDVYGMNVVLSQPLIMS